VDVKDAATFAVAAQTAIQSIARYVEEGSKVVINGASGGKGMFGTQIAKSLGCAVTAICSGLIVQFCKNLGVDNIINYKSVYVVQELKKGGLQYDLIVNNVAVKGSIYTMSHHYFRKQADMSRL
jgi:NADPH:quinone reductase-like Zn-dependent oxidoreductase